MTVFEFNSNAQAGSDLLSLFTAGKGATSRVVGNDYQDGSIINRIARYTFTTPAEGANHFSFLIHTNGLGDGNKCPLRFFVGTDPTSHINAWDTSEYTGEATISSNNKIVTGEADIILMPNTTYYLFIFPGSKSVYGWYSWYSLDNINNFTFTGGAGVSYIKAADGTVNGYQWYVRTADGWKLMLPYIKKPEGFTLFPG